MAGGQPIDQLAISCRFPDYPGSASSLFICESLTPFLALTNTLLLLYSASFDT